MPREILTDWHFDSGEDGVSVMFFDESIPVADQRADLAVLWGSVDSMLHNGTQWVIRNSGRELDDATGSLTGVWTDVTTQTGIGAGTVNPVNDAAMILLQWQTSTIINGRMVRGRTFVPGAEVSTQEQGNLGAGFVSQLNGYQATFLASGSGFGVWHRPTSGSGGQFVTATAGSAWPEFAVLRGRRG